MSTSSSRSQVSRGGLRRLRRYVPKPLQPAVRGLFMRVGPITSRFRMDPSFIVIGGQRCGTTTIFKKLSEHPQVMRPPVEKGTDYYTLHSSRGNDWYRGNFPLRALANLQTRSTGPAVAFEACTYYMFHPFALQRLARDYPNIKLVAMLRDPVERAYSAYKHEYARNFEAESDFVRALDLEDSRLEGEYERMAADPDYESFSHRHHAYRRRGQYAEQLQRALRYFSPEQLHVMESEAFFADGAAEYAKLLKFLELAPWIPQDFEQFNARPGAPMPAEAHQRLTSHYMSHDEDLADLLGRRPFWMGQR